MRFVTYNIRYGLGRDGAIDLGRIADAVVEADVIALQEVDRFWPRSAMVNQPLALAELLPDHFWVFGPAIDLHTPLAEPGSEGNRRRQFGNMLLSRGPILASTVLPLPRAIPPETSMARVAVEGVISTRRGPLRVYSVHLSYGSERTRRMQTEELVDRHLNSVARGGAWIGNWDPGIGNWILGDEPEIPQSALVLGDFNLVAGSPEYESLFGGTASAALGLVDAWRVAGNDEQDSYAGEGRLDYGFISGDLRSAVGGAWMDESAVGSDHYPVWFDLDL